jgi:hypothetical protein
MKASEMIRALECMPGDAEVYFEQWLPSGPSERTLSVKKIDTVHCIIDGHKDGVISEITLMCDEDNEQIED